jgi:hypothetical protein
VLCTPVTSTFPIVRLLSMPEIDKYNGKFLEYRSEVDEPGASSSLYSLNETVVI